MNIIDAHIHLDHYKHQDIENVVLGDCSVSALIGVSVDLASCKKNLMLSRQYTKVKPAFGWHPEQELISEHDLNELIHWIKGNNNEMIAIGEVGLPFYSKNEKLICIEEYLTILEHFVKLASELNKPIILHAIYDDAPVVCNLLEKYSITKAHFHWFKGDLKTSERIFKNGYYISITPDILYEKEIQNIAKYFPIENIMVETDGPWPFEGPFQNKKTHPSMIHQSIKAISYIKNLPLDHVYFQLYKNTQTFYNF